VCVCVCVCVYVRMYVRAYLAISCVSDNANVRQIQSNMNDDDCFYCDSWRNNVVIAFGTLSSLDMCLTIK